MSVSVSVGPGTSLPQRALLVPSVLGGQRSRGPWGLQQQQSCRMGSWLRPPGAHLHPQSLFPSASAGKGSRGGLGDTPQAPVFWGHSWPSLGCCGCSPQPWAARGGSDARDLSQASSSLVSVQKYSESCSVPGSQPICPPPLRAVWPLPTPALATSIHGHQYSQGPSSPGKLGRAVSA